MITIVKGTVGILVAAFFLVVSAKAIAAGTAAPKEKAPATKTITVFKKKDKIEFGSGLKLKGQLKKPDLSYIYKRRGLRAEQIVNIPENFNEEIIQGENQF